MPVSYPQLLLQLSLPQWLNYYSSQRLALVPPSKKKHCYSSWQSLNFQRSTSARLRCQCHCYSTSQRQVSVRRSDSPRSLAVSAVRFAANTFSGDCLDCCCCSVRWHLRQSARRRTMMPMAPAAVQWVVSCRLRRGLRLQRQTRLARPPLQNSSRLGQLKAEKKYSIGICQQTNKCKNINCCFPDLAMKW